MAYKQVILVRKDLNLPKGKLAAQVAHAAVDAASKVSSSMLKEWKQHGAKKVILWVEDEKELILYQKKAASSKIVSALIRDAGRTVLKSGTVTALAIGPAEEGKVEALTGRLKMV